MKSENEFKEFYRNSFGRVFNCVYSRLSNFHDVEDVVSEVYASVWASWGKVEKNNAIYFTFKIARNKTNDFLRRQYKIFENFCEETVEDIAEKFDSDKPLRNQGKLKTVLDEVLQTLTERDRLFFRLKYKENKSYLEISKILNITKNNAKVINNRLIKKFKSRCQRIKI